MTPLTQHPNLTPLSQRAWAPYHCPPLLFRRRPAAYCSSPIRSFHVALPSPSPRALLLTRIHNATPSAPSVKSQSTQNNEIKLKKNYILLNKYIRRQNARQERIAGRQKPFPPPPPCDQEIPQPRNSPAFLLTASTRSLSPNTIRRISAASPFLMEDDDDARSDSQSPSPPPSPPPHPISVVAPSSSAADTSPDVNGRAAIEPVTVAAPPHHTLTLALPIQRPPGGGGGGGGGGGREDCWSEGATSTLIDAWGERYLELSRGNLKQKHWQEVADAVTSRESYTKTAKSDVQCKNRIDTLKKKYKIEKSKIVSGVAATSSWPFFSRLDDLLGPNHKPTPAPAPALPASANPSNPQHPSKIPAGVPILPQFPQRQRTPHRSWNQSKKSRRSPPSVSSRSAEMSADSSDGFPPAPAVNGKRRKRATEPEDEVEEGVRELVQAILKFGEVFERVESSKLQQAMEMEKQRMAFTRELELQRMQFFMKTQMELTQLKSRHLGRKKRRRRDEAGASGNHHHHHHHHQNSNSSNSNNSPNSG